MLWHRVLSSISLSLLMSINVQAERIKDIASIAGVRDNYLVGYGLVVGLDGRVIKRHKRLLLRKVLKAC